MAENSKMVTELLSGGVAPKKLAEARHMGWLVGVALRLGVGKISRNPFDRDSEEWLYWETGCEEGLAG